jgi:hypothetical protein
VKVKARSEFTDPDGRRAILDVEALVFEYTS